MRERYKGGSSNIGKRSPLLRAVAAQSRRKRHRPELRHPSAAPFTRLALIARKLYNYINKHIVTLQAHLDADTYTCLTGMLACLQKILAYLNKEAP